MPSSPPDDVDPDLGPVVLGDGPIELVARRFLEGEVDWPTAIELAKKPAITTQIGDRYARAVANWSSKLMMKGETQLALVLIDLLRAATSNFGDNPEEIRTRDTVDLRWLEVNAASLMGSPNWDVYADARQAGEAFLERARGRGLPDLMHSILHALGAMHLDPLTAHQVDWVAWKARWGAWYKEGAAASRPDAEPYPEPIQAFELAHGYFRQAADLSEGEKRGESLKAIVQTLQWHAIVDGVKRDQEIADIAHEALSLLDPQKDLLKTTFLLGAIQRAERPIDPGVLKQLAMLSVQGVLETGGALQGLAGLTNLVELLRRIDPALALDLAERARSEAAQSRDESLSQRHCMAGVKALADFLCPEKIDNDAGTLVAARQAAERGERENWTPDRFSGALLGLAVRAAPRDEEMEALQLLGIAEKTTPEIFQRFEWFLKGFRATLAAGAGVNAFNGDDAKTALRCYSDVVHLALELGWSSFAKHHLDKLVDVAWKGGSDLLIEMLVVLFSIGPRIEVSLGQDGGASIQNMALRMTEDQIAAGSANSMLLHFIWQIAKAARFGRALTARASRRLREDDVSSSLLEKIARLRADVPLSREGTGPGSKIDRELRLLNFVREDVPSRGATPLERLTNLQHRFDRRLEQRLTFSAASEKLSPLALDDLQAALDERTALAQFHLGTYQQGRVRLVLGATRGQVFCRGLPDRTGLLVELKEGVRVEHAYSYALDVFRLRRALAAGEPDSSEIESALKESADWIVGGLDETLKELAAQGHDHLCVLPHGPLHYVPFHLLPLGEGVLGDHWTVTTVPSVEILRRGSDNGPERSGLRSFGVTFTQRNPYRLTPLPEAADEARRVAQAFGEQALVDDAVTEGAVREALCRARYVHIATHGALNLDAPAFQYLVVTPDDTSDGVLYAHELLELDLTGLQLVTLSACETALGRVDRCDNPRGLPATLLLAGAEALVGTLWDVQSDVARAFFVELYQALSDGEERLQAYRRAQLETKRRFPQPHEWGAFYYMGAW